MEIRQDVAYCAGCFQAKPGTDHVDFDASYDGPTMTNAEGEPIKATIDELVLCADCVDRAATLMGYAKSDDRQRVKDLEERLAAKTREAFLAEQALADIRKRLPAETAPPRRGPGRPRKQAATA